MKKRVKEELERLKEDGVIKKSDILYWAIPIIPVVKGTDKKSIIG